MGREACVTVEVGVAVHAVSSSCQHLYHTVTAFTFTHQKHTISKPLSLSVFCSGLGGPEFLAPFSANGGRVMPFSSGVRVVRLPVRLSFPANEFMLLLTLCPGVGEPGFGPLTMPLRVGICDWLPGPSEERRSRVAGGRALTLVGVGVAAPPFFDDLKRKDILSRLVWRKCPRRW